MIRSAASSFCCVDLPIDVVNAPNAIANATITAPMIIGNTMNMPTPIFTPLITLDSARTGAGDEVACTGATRATVTGASGYPHCGHTAARSDTSRPHSTHGINMMISLRFTTVWSRD